MRINVKVSGIDKVMNDFSRKGMRAQTEADQVTETYTRKMANQSGEMAPVKSGDLRESIIASPRRLRLGVWQYGSHLPYARRQEYEHRTKKGFIRKSVYKNRNEYREALRREVSKWR